MDDDDATFLDMLRYFHEAKGDITRYCYFNENRFRDLAPEAWSRWRNLRLAKKDFDISMRHLGE